MSHPPALAALVLALASSSGAQAQSTPPSPTMPPALPTPADLAGRPAAPAHQATVPPAPRVPRQVAPPDSDVRMEVKAYSLNADAPAEVKAALTELTRPFVGKDKSFADLADAAAALTTFLQRELGYYLGFAYIPEQDPQGGVVRLEVLEGRLDRVDPVKCPANLPVACDLIQRYLDALQPGDVLKVKDVERVVFLVNDLRGISAEFEFQPGRTPGTARLVVKPKAMPVTSVRAEYANGNARSLGADRYTVNLTHLSPFRRADSFTASLVSSRGLSFGMLNYLSPVGANGARVGVSASALDYSVDNRLFPLSMHGTATTVSALGLYPLVRSRNFNLFSSLSLDNKRYFDSVAGESNSKRVRSGTLGLTGDLRDAWGGGAINSLDLQFTQGVLDTQLVSSANVADSGFGKLSLRAARLQNLKPGVWQAYLSLRAQAAWNNLDSTEQFRVGGPDGVRAFPAGEGSGDQGAVATAEVRWIAPAGLLPSIGGTLVVSLFADRAAVQLMRHPTVGTDNRRQDYSGWGLGLTWSHSSGWDFRSTLATPVINQSQDSEERSSTRLFVQLGKQF